MTDRFIGVRSGAMDDLLIKRVISDALSRLKKSTPPESDKPRTDEELHGFLEQVKSELQRFNIPIPGTEIHMPSDPPKGIAWAVKVAMCNQGIAPEFIEFVRNNGQSDVYLAALALSSPESDDHGEIRALQAALEMLKESVASTRQRIKANNPRSPFIALVRLILKNTPADKVEDIWQKLNGYNGYLLEFNKKQLEISLTFDLEETPGKEDHKPLDRRIVHWDTGDYFGSQLRRTLNSEISKLRRKHGISKGV